MDYYMLIKEWIMQFHDESTLGVVPYCYNPLLHVDGIKFYFNPPFNEEGRSIPTICEELAVTEEGEVMLLDWDMEWCKLSDCPPQGYEGIYYALYDVDPEPQDAPSATNGNDAV